MLISFDLSFKAFWKKVALFAYRRWSQDEPAGRKPAGVPGNRDPDYPCTSYSPRPFAIGMWNDCEGDGHYLCQGCSHLKKETED